jgi:hypothetical protein
MPSPKPELRQAVIAETLAAISNEQYQAMRARVVALLPRITYFPRPLHGVEDAVDLVVAQMTRPRPPAAGNASVALLLQPVVVPADHRLPLPPKGLAWGHPKFPDEECRHHFKDPSSCTGRFRLAEEMFFYDQLNRSRGSSSV